ncbi:hypothetical protein N7513_004670 [Penicillium frequentans]|nr:hypothetical protein N7513_004670 [Penicillium glabrum]
MAKSHSPLLDICFVQEPQSRSRFVEDPIVIYTVALESRFGIKAQATKAYYVDKSGLVANVTLEAMSHHITGPVILLPDSWYGADESREAAYKFHRYQNLFRTPAYAERLREQSHRSQ